MRTFPEFVEFFDREIDALCRAPFQLTFREMVRVLAGPAVTVEAEAACHTFAKTLEWPLSLPDHIRLEVCVRLATAREWCVACGEGEVETDEAEAEFLNEFLVDYYKEAGKDHWIAYTFLNRFGTTGLTRRCCDSRLLLKRQ